MAEVVSPNEYPFKGVALTAAVVEYLALELFRGKLVERHVIGDEVIREHLARGGRNAKVATITGSLRNALTHLKEKGFVENPAVGYWRFPTNCPTIESAVELRTPDLPVLESPPAAALEKPALPEVVADVVLGKGPAAVYLYYLPIYRLRAEEQQENMWPCKIGRTDRDPLARVLVQAGTALPERPHIALVIRTPFPVAWEAALHNVLELRGRRIDDSPGSEWFLTSPDEVGALAKLFDPTLADGGETQVAGGTGAG